MKLESLVSLASKEMKSALHNAAKAKTNGHIILIAFTLAALIIAIILGIVMARYFAKRIKEIANSAKKIAR